MIIETASQSLKLALPGLTGYRANRRWGRSAINSEPRGYLSAARTWLRQARRWFANAQAIDAAPMREAA